MADFKEPGGNSRLLVSEMEASNRTMRCDCGLVMSRDQNAAINIKNEGLRMLNIA